MIPFPASVGIMRTDHRRIFQRHGVNPKIREIFGLALFDLAPVEDNADGRGPVFQ